MWARAAWAAIILLGFLLGPVTAGTRIELPIQNRLGSVRLQVETKSACMDAIKSPVGKAPIYPQHSFAKLNFSCNLFVTFYEGCSIMRDELGRWVCGGPAIFRIKPVTRVIVFKRHIVPITQPRLNWHGSGFACCVEIQSGFFAGVLVIHSHNESIFVVNKAIWFDPCSYRSEPSPTLNLHLAQLVIKNPVGTERENSGHRDTNDGNYATRGIIALGSAILFFLGVKLVGDGVKASRYSTKVGYLCTFLGVLVIWLAIGFFSFFVLPLPALHPH